jgi:hypothetical protein
MAKGVEMSMVSLRRAWEVPLSPLGEDRRGRPEVGLDRTRSGRRLLGSIDTLSERQILSIVSDGEVRGECF